MHGRIVIATLVALLAGLPTSTSVAAEGHAPPLRLQTHAGPLTLERHATSGRGRLVALPGSAFRARTHGPAIGVATTAPLTAYVMLRPRHARLLARLARSGTARRPLSARDVHALFDPAPQAVRRLTRYLRRHGLVVQRRSGLALELRGTAAEAEAAFNVRLLRYPAARGRLVRVPAGPVRLPASVARSVQAVGGLDTELRMHSHAARQPHTVGPDPSCASGVQNAILDNGGGWLPAELAGAYGYDTLIDASPQPFTGSGQAIAFTEYSRYVRSDVSAFQQCFGLTNPFTDHTVGSGPANASGRDEVVLDIETAMAAAPGAEMHVYEARNNVAAGVAILNAIGAQSGTTHVTAVSNSWGLCEALIPPSILAAENTALQLLAVRGISFVTASGDLGSSDCYPYSRSLLTDDPASQPYATAVGGTSLSQVTPAVTESAWRTPDSPATGAFDAAAGGGGVSSTWTMPAWQASQADVRAAVAAASTGRKCGAAGVLCRGVPDVALSADPADGHVVFSRGGWQVFGGTSAAAPLLAGMVADADDAAVAAGRQPLGFATPFLYAHRDAVADVAAGTNSLFASRTTYTAGAGYDLATGLGSVRAQKLADDLIADGRSTAGSFRRTAVAGLTPGATKRITYGRALTFAGVLRNAVTRAPVRGRRVDLEVSLGGYLYGWRTTTTSTGHWSIRLKTALRGNLRWRVVFTGTEALRPTITGWRAVRVTPRLTAAVARPRVNGRYIAAVGQPFTFSGRTRPNMYGARVMIQYRFSRRARWHNLAAVPVSRRGRLAARLTDGARGISYLRWRYAGGARKRWMTAVSPSVTVLAR